MLVVNVVKLRKLNNFGTKLYKRELQITGLTIIIA